MQEKGRLMKSRNVGVLRSWAGLSCVLVALSSGRADDAGQELARNGTALIEKYCYRCHGAQRNGSPLFVVLDRDGLINSKAKYVVPGKPDESYMWQRVADGEMPPEGEPAPSAAEKDVLKAWIAAGVPQVERVKRPHKKEEQVLRDILADLQATAQKDRAYQRYFTITHLFNNNVHYTEQQLRLVRAAFSKSVNSLSWQSEMVIPKAIDSEQTIFRLDLRDLGWDQRNVWTSILRQYPYGLKFNKVDDLKLVEIDRQVELMSGTPLAYVRADWFTVTATRPPLYHEILDLPKSAEELEKKLQVTVERDFLQDRLKRAGFAESGVSTANRLVDRHASVFGYYWKSYDFAPNREKGNLQQFPLGPSFDGHPYPQNAFEQDGGEVIFSLPNGLQGYYLINAKGERIDEGPIAVVRDLSQTSGSPVVVNGISCMHCHQHGMIPFKDTVRQGLGVFGGAREKALALYTPREQMDETVQKDRKKFLSAVDEAMGAFLKVGEHKEKTVDQIEEPVGAVARSYQRDVSLADAAIELGIEDANELKIAVRVNPQLKKLGLGPIVDGNSVKRTEWESRRYVTSPFQEAARLLDRGTPLIFLGGQ